MRVLITGTAGFIGFHLAKRMIGMDHEIIGLDNINDYYDVGLKHARLEQSGIFPDKISYGKILQSRLFRNYYFIKLNLEDGEAIKNLFKEHQFDWVIHLAAQAGVRYSLSNPHTYVQSNLSGFLNMLEACRYYPVQHLVYASSSSVYGLNQKMPFSVRDNIDHPVSLYAVSKKANELMAHAYSHLFNIPLTGLRFFTVYGPWGRPDMALFIFTRKILSNEPIDVFNNGNMERDFTYIEDIVEGMVRVMQSPPKGNEAWDGKNPDPSTSPAPYRLYNIGNNSPVRLMDFIEAIENATGKTAIRNYLPLQPGDVERTWADTDDLARDFDYKPATPIPEGIRKFVEWYKSFYQV